MNYIAENTRRYRAKLGLTQEQIAERVGVTAQAVSKWERGEALPDTAILVPLSSALGVTPNELLGYDTVAIQGEIKARLAELARLKSLGRDVEAFAHVRRAHEDFPNDYKIMARYVDVLCYEPRPEFDGNSDSWRVNRDEILRLARRVYDESRDADLRFEAIVSLAGCYTENGEREKAVEICNELPESGFYTRSVILAHFVYEDGSPEQLEHERKITCGEIEGLVSSVRHRAWEKGVTPEEKILILDKALLLADAVFEDGDYGFVACWLADAASEIARIYVKNGDVAAALPYARRSFELARYYDAGRERGEPVTLTSRLVRGHIWRPNDVNTSGDYSGAPVWNKVGMYVGTYEKLESPDARLLALCDEYRGFAKAL
ncbi:MAG: helix-turn-helix domain-containing protein [Oscillospiraceae bacterium]|jgi:transcriptional regulator with XRE-family HTH domain|nr:helix-turn-helix domain-containing protein [Oscillospiraceae bacterium]